MNYTYKNVTKYKFSKKIEAKYLIQKSIAYPKVLASMLMQSSQILSYRIEKIIMLLVQY